MADIKLFSIANGVIEKVHSTVSLEKQLQNLIEQNMETFFGVTFLASEYRTTEGRMDSIGIDENNCPVIFEYKRNVSESVINQGLYYLNWLLDHKANFTLLVMEKLGEDKVRDIDWSMPCVICIANDFTKFDENAVREMQRNIKLVRYKQYDNELIIFEFLNNPHVQPMQADEQVKPTKKTVTTDKTFSQRYEEAPQPVRDLYDSIRDYILSLGDDVTENILKLYSAFKKVKNITCAEIQVSYGILLHIHLNPDKVDLVQGFIEDARNKGHWGTGDLEIRIKNLADFEQIKPLLNRAYNEN